VEDPRLRQLRYLAWSVAFVMAVVAWFQDSPSAALWLRLTAAFIFAAGTVFPRLLRRPYLWLRSGFRWIVATLMKPPRQLPPAETAATQGSLPR
jgi:hypothetical protein